MVQCDSILSIDEEKKQVRVQAGARVTDVVEALRPHGLTLQNYASIAEQQIGGFLQVGAHGTGAGVPPVDEQVTRLVLHTPALGPLELSESQNPKLFYLAKVGLGWLGVVSEVTIQCVPAHKLVQHTYVETRHGIEKRHREHQGLTQCSPRSVHSALNATDRCALCVLQVSTYRISTCATCGSRTPTPSSSSRAIRSMTACRYRRRLLRSGTCRRRRASHVCSRSPRSGTEIRLRGSRTAGAQGRHGRGGYS